MPPSTNKRSQRVRREVANNTDIPDSSPSRPAKRRKKVQEPVEMPEPEPESEPQTLPADQAGIDMDNEGILDAVVQCLHTSPHETIVRQMYSNSRYEGGNISAFAKLAGNDWTYHISRVETLIGRPGDNAPGTRRPSPGNEDTVHIDMGPSKLISRKHAQIAYDADTREWYIEVLGRNPIKVDDERVWKGSRRELLNGQVIDIIGMEMIFVLPSNEPLNINKKYLMRAGLIQLDAQFRQTSEAAGNETDQGQETAAQSSSVPSGSRGQNGSGPLPIAPAPPDYKRPGTPPASRPTVPFSAGKSPRIGGTMMMDNDNVDLSIDENKHIKPTFSYAQLISQAILNTKEEKLTLSGIYTYIQESYAYYRHQLGGGWQNSIRHNLSLNKAFTKVARSTDEPGKGMKWHIVPEYREEMGQNRFKGGRGGHRGSPGSPNNAGLQARAARTGESSSQKSRRSPRSGSPSMGTSHLTAFTPKRDGQEILDDQPGDGSPLPRHRRQQNNAFGLSDNALGSPPAMSSSYMQDESTSFTTPAPHRVHPRLAPPSTAQRPSQHMPTSSPAPFWKYADLGQTPMKGQPFDSSPVKGFNAGPDLPPSSSPAPARRLAATSPTRNGRKEPDPVEEEEEEVGFDLTKGFQSIGAFHAPLPSGPPVGAAGR